MGVSTQLPEVVAFLVGVGKIYGAPFVPHPFANADIHGGFQVWIPYDL